MPRLPSKHSAQIPHPAFSSPFLDSHSGSHASLAIIQPKRKENRTATTTPFRIDEDLCSSIVLHLLVVLAAAAQQDANPLLFFWRRWLCLLPQGKKKSTVQTKDSPSHKFAIHACSTKCR
jgi:hypothetical protein